MNLTGLNPIRSDSVIRLALIALLAMVSACASSAPHLGGDPQLQVTNALEMPVPDTADITARGTAYFVGPQDKLMVEVYGIPEMSPREVQVDSQGQIALPIVGRLDVYGKTPAEIGELLAAQLQINYVRDPQVTVNLKESRGQVVTVEGQVTKPGLYPVVNHMSLLRTIALSGGLSDLAKLDDVVVFRVVRGQRYAALYNLKLIRKGAYPDPAIYADDVIVVGDSSSRRLFKDILQFAPLLLTPFVIALDQVTK